MDLASFGVLPLCFLGISLPPKWFQVQWTKLCVSAATHKIMEGESNLKQGALKRKMVFHGVYLRFHVRLWERAGGQNSGSSTSGFVSNKGTGNPRFFGRLPFGLRERG